MNIKTAEYISLKEIKITLDYALEVVVNDIKTTTSTLILYKHADYYIIENIFLDVVGNFKSSSYPYDDVELLNADKIMFHKFINNTMQFINIIPLNYLFINNVYHEVKNLDDLKKLQFELTSEELNIPMSSVECRFFRRCDKEGGLSDTCFNRIDKATSSTILTSGTLLTFFKTLKEKSKPPTKTISFKDEFWKEYEYLLKMEQTKGNLSRFMCLVIREHMENHPEE